MIENIEYNTERDKLIIPEYGRHIQKMVDYATSIQDDEERNKVAKSIIAVMGNLNPHLRDVPDFQHKLWDQLFIMSKFELDVESPFPKPSKEVLEERPERLDYPQNHPKYRFYGNNIKRMIDAAISWEDGELKELLINTIGNHMKKCFLNWNKDTVEDDVIFEHLFELSEGQIDIRNSEIKLSESSELVKNKKYTNQNNKKHKNNRNSNNRNNNRKRY